MLRRWMRIAILLLALSATAVRVGPAAGRIVEPPGAEQPIAESLPARAILEGYPQLYQQHRLSCEAASVSMATGGLIGEGTIVAAMPTSSDPWLGFRGTIDRHATLADGLANYGIYAPPLAREMQDFGYQTTVISGTEAPALLRYSIGQLRLPVVAWVTYGLHDEPAIVGQTGAESFPLVLHEHARLIVGYDAGGVYSHDPIDGPRYDPWPAFLRAWSTFDQMGLIVAPAFPRHDPPALAVQLAEHAVTWSWPQPAWPLADEVTISQAGQPLHRFILAPAAQGANDLGQGIFSGATSDPTEGLSVPLGSALTALPLDPSLSATPYLPVEALLGGPHARPGTAALTLRLAPGTPYTITVAAIDPLGVIYPAVTSPEVVDIPSASPPGTPLFPPASFFVLPPDIAAGHTVVVPLRPEDIGSPSKPLTRLEYDIGSDGRGYRVDLFASLADASVSFAWQLAHPQAKLRLLPAAASLPGFRLYTIPGYAVATVLYRNIEFAASVPTRGGTVSGQRGRRAGPGAGAREPEQRLYREGCPCTAQQRTAVIDRPATLHFRLRRSGHIPPERSHAHQRRRTLLRLRVYPGRPHRRGDARVPRDRRTERGDRPRDAGTGRADVHRRLPGDRRPEGRSHRHRPGRPVAACLDRGGAVAALQSLGGVRLPEPLVPGHGQRTPEPGQLRQQGAGHPGTRAAAAADGARLCPNPTAVSTDSPNLLDAVKADLRPTG